jgi:hypothetical protein
MFLASKPVEGLLGIDSNCILECKMLPNREDEEALDAAK